MQLNPITLTDAYKTDHRRQYPDGIEKVYSNFTARSTRIAGQDEVIFLGLQYFLHKYFKDEFNAFFDAPVQGVCAEYERRMNNYLGPNGIGSDHIKELHKLGYIPLEVKAFPEGSHVPLGIPMLTVENTHEDFAWVVNYFETLLSSVLWLPITSATTASRFRAILEFYAKQTGSSEEFIDFQGHDFSFRGMQGPEAAALSGLGHLLSFVGTDTIPAIDLAERAYMAPKNGSYLVGASVAATEHSVMCAGGADDELETFRRLLKLYPEGILSVVSDTWNLWNVCTNILPQLKGEIMARNGKLVIRPDSGDPVDIVAGDPEAAPDSPQFYGVIELLHQVFGGTETSTGHIMLDEHIGCIYGDSINEDRMHGILSRLQRKGFASGNMVFGLGSYTYTFVTRDTYGMAMKATWCQINGEGKNIYKNPVTDDGGKKSAKGRLAVLNINNKLQLIQEATPEQEENSMLQTIWKNGVWHRSDSFMDIRERARA